MDVHLPCPSYENPPVLNRHETNIRGRWITFTSEWIPQRYLTKKKSTVIIRQVPV